MHKNKIQKLKQNKITAVQNRQNKPLTVEERQSLNDNQKLIESENANQIEKVWWRSLEKIQAIINGAMVILTFFLMLYAIKQWEVSSDSLKAAQEANKQTREHFQQDQRPYVWLTNSLGAPECVSAQKDARDCQIIWSWHFTNYGKSPARELRFTEAINFGESVLEKPRKFGKISLGAPLPPNKDDFSTVVSETKISREEFARLLNTEQSILIAGRLNYTDGAGGQYETGFCLYRLRTGAIAYCRDGNYVK